MQYQNGVLLMRCEPIHPVSRMPKPKFSPDVDFHS